MTMTPEQLRKRCDDLNARLREHLELPPEQHDINVVIEVTEELLDFAKQHVTDLQETLDNLKEKAAKMIEAARMIH